MRLIDANALIAEQCGQCDGACEMFDVEKCLACKSDFRCDLREAIDNAPTLDYAPVRHGEWGAAEIVGYDGIFAVYAVPCSACKEYTELYRARYCPNCGALMDGKEDAHV